MFLRRAGKQHGITATYQPHIVTTQLLELQRTQLGMKWFQLMLSWPRHHRRCWSYLTQYTILGGDTSCKCKMLSIPSTAPHKHDPIFPCDKYTKQIPLSVKQKRRPRTLYRIGAKCVYRAGWSLLAPAVCRSVFLSSKCPFVRLYNII